MYPLAETGAIAEYLDQQEELGLAGDLKTIRAKDLLAEPSTIEKRRRNN